MTTADHTPTPQRLGEPVVTSRLVLRGARLSDVNDLFECFKDGEVMRYWDTLPHSSPEETRRWVEKMIDGPRNGVMDFVIGLSSGGNASRQGQGLDDVTPSSGYNVKVIGKVGIWQGNEIGFLLSREYWGQGLATEAVKAVLDIAFGSADRENAIPCENTHAQGRLELEDVTADVDPRNKASLSVLKKLGFEVYATKEKTFKIGEEWVDSVYLSLRRHVWLIERQKLG